MLDKLIEYLKGLPEEEQAKLLAVLQSEGGQAEYDEARDGGGNGATETETEETPENQEGHGAAEKTQEESLHGETTEQTEPTDDIKDTNEHEGATEETTKLVEDPKPVEDGLIPPMQKGVGRPEDKSQPAATEEPTDSVEQQAKEEEQKALIASMEAKIQALEVENSELKKKINSAFGYSAKPSVTTKINRLYDSCEGIHIHK